MATNVAHVALNTLCLSAAAALGSLPFFFLKTLTERAMAAGNALAGLFYFCPLSTNFCQHTASAMAN
jgi:hypothetical protein